MKKCPYCAEEIQNEALFCRHCGHDTRVPIPEQGELRISRQAISGQVTTPTDSACVLAPPTPPHQSGDEALDQFRKLVAQLKSLSWVKRYDACEELRVSETIPAYAVEALRVALQDPDSVEVREAAGRALAIHESDGQPTDRTDADFNRLIAVLKSTDWKKRQEACEELGSSKIIPPYALQALRDRTLDIIPSVADAARRALAVHEPLATTPQEAASGTLATALSLTADSGSVGSASTHPGTKSCPVCAETIKFEAIFCRYCGRDTRIPVPEPPGVDSLSSSGAQLSPGTSAEGSLSVQVSVRTSGNAVASLVFGLIGFGLPLIGAIIAIVTGNIAKRQVRAGGGRITGDGLATAGLVLGYLQLVLLVAVVVIVVLALLGSSVGK